MKNNSTFGINKIVTKLMKVMRCNRVLVNGAMFSIFSFINRGFSFLLLLLLANYIGPEEYGYLSLFTTVLMIIGYFIAMSTEGYVSVAYFKDKQYGLTNTISVVVFITLIVGAFLFSIVSAFRDKISSWLSLPVDVIYLAIGISVFMVYNNVYLDLFRLRGKTLTYGVVSCSNALFNLILSILLVKTLQYGWQGRVYAQFFCCVVYGLLGLSLFIRNKYIRVPSKLYLKKIIIWGLPIILHSSVTFIRQGCDRYIINYFYSLNDVGLFSFALNVSNVIVLIGIGFNQSNSVDIYRVLSNESMSKDEKLKHLYRQRHLIMRIYLFLTLLAVALSYLLCPLLLPQYSGAMNYFLILSLWGFLLCLYFLYTNYLFYYGKTKTIMCITFGTSLLHFALSLLLTRFSLYCTCGIYVISQLLILYLIKKKSEHVMRSYLS